MLNIEKERENFLEHVSCLVEYWNREDLKGDQKERLEGLAFSILSFLDGCSGSIHSVIPAEEVSDGIIFDHRNNIAGCLHDEFYSVHNKRYNK